MVQRTTVANDLATGSAVMFPLEHVEALVTNVAAEAVFIIDPRGMLDHI